MDADVIVIGAGAAGLMAAYRLSKKGTKVTLLEARSRCGGRILTLQEPFSQPVEGGAEFIHGNLKRTIKLLRKAGLDYETANGAFWRYDAGRFYQQEDVVDDYQMLMDRLRQLKEDQSVGSFLDQKVPEPRYHLLKEEVKSYVEGYYAGDLYKASALSLKEEWEEAADEQYRVKGGYGSMIEYLYRQCLHHHCRFHFDTVVQAIHWEKHKIRVEAGPSVFTARQVVIAVPLGVLQNKTGQAAIQFHPGIPQKTAALQQLGFGGTIKILLEWKEAFWKKQPELADMSFLFSKESVPTWWTQHPAGYPLLVGWIAGPHAAALQHHPDEALLEKALHSLSAIFQLPAGRFRELLTAWKVCNWAADPFTQGGYTYITVGTHQALKTLSVPEQDTLFFAGEAFYDGIEVGTVEAALRSGRKVARTLLGLGKHI